MEKIISFIIPSYNVAHCLSVCLDSFLIKKEEGFEQLEVIVVDDGSKDETADVAKRYTERFPEVYRLIQKENGGHGSAINVGSREARGKYLKVVDADDWVVTEHLPLLLKKLEACEADVVLTPFHQVNMADGAKYSWKMYCAEYEKNYSMAEIISDWKSFDRCLTFHGIMYRCGFYQQYRHELPLRVFYEDQEYATIPCCHAKTIYPINLYLYQYLIGNTEQSVSDENRLKRISHVEKVTCNLLKYGKCHSDSLSPEGMGYLFTKTEAVILSHYVVNSVIQPDKAQGRRDMERYNRMIGRLSPEMLRRVWKKYRVYLLLNYTHIPYGLYKKLLRSRLYSIVRKSHQIKKE